MTKFGAAENEMKRLTAKFAQGTPAEYSLYRLTYKCFPFYVPLITVPLYRALTVVVVQGVTGTYWCQFNG